METLLSIALGLGLAAAAGLRVFVPVFGASLAAHLGVLPLSPSFAWVGTLPALIAFGTATALEIGAYYVPWLDHALDVVASPAAVIAGVVASAAVITDLPPLVTWTVALIGGGGAAGIVQMLSVGARVKSAVTTGGLGNPVVATGETVGAIALTAMTLLVPLVALVVCIVFVFLLARFVWRRRNRSAATSS
ncbi:MAG: DUF4126 domain-containing protein [Gemmatimonadetes bacterium]|nr:DUF4126 domain-containing protein [Gemmatimonadota bacterium]MBK7833996.1 DUF4126 domain-containing protein [Gemmatimonadota bacterium]MBK8060351.1 DUF4126 domain-containing protein [Gemmatimonadota bacterium]MBK8648280.1 DUF4126 domain-containing protein [Gemmatimonadota bacterium]